MEGLGKTTDGPIARLINRRLSGRITNFILHHDIPLSPDGASVISFLVAVVSSVFYLLRLPLLGGVFVQASSIIDGVDGELARLTGRSSASGAFLDTMLDRVADIFIIIGASIFVAESRGLSGGVLVISLLALSGDLLVSYLHSEGRVLLGTFPGGAGKIPMFASRDVRLFILFLFSITSRVLEGLGVVAIISYAYVLLKTGELLNIRRNMGF